MTVLLDEIFIGSQPILITLEPISSAIINIELADNRIGETWEKHLNYPLKNRNIVMTNVVSDNGSGIILGVKNSLENVHRQPDTFHALSHHLGIWVSRLESKAYSSIKEEYRLKAVYLNRKTERTIKEKKELYAEVYAKTIKAIELYEDFRYLYLHAIRQLNPFESNGILRNITKAIKNCKSLGVDDETIRILSLEWQWNKNWIKAKNPQRKKSTKEKNSKRTDR